jgi:hypothetical protein
MMLLNSAQRFCQNDLNGFAVLLSTAGPLSPCGRAMCLHLHTQTSFTDGFAEMIRLGWFLKKKQSIFSK